jgi:hypothetical protein
MKSADLMGEQTMCPDNAGDKLVTIPFFDVREGGPLSIIEKNKEAAANLIKASTGAYGVASQIASHLALPVGDNLSMRWLKKTKNPYTAEIEKTAQVVGGKGVIALNMSYEWGCTSGAYQADAGAPTLARILDWPFPALGEHTMVLQQKGPGGEFYNVTWPGMCGVYNAVAPGRFAAAINQAPMRRRRTGIFLDWARNRHFYNTQDGWPPSHLLRYVFENAKNYAEAKKMLSEMRLSIPVIFILSGTKDGEGCVIERTEDKAAIREMKEGRVLAANHFETHLNGLGHGWMPRATCSHSRACAASETPLADFNNEFEWFREPIANYVSRLAMTANADTGHFKVIGTAGATPVTKVFRM